MFVSLLFVHPSHHHSFTGLPNSYWISYVEKGHELVVKRLRFKFCYHLSEAWSPLPLLDTGGSLIYTMRLIMNMKALENFTVLSREGASVKSKRYVSSAREKDKSFGTCLLGKITHDSLLA